MARAKAEVVRLLSARVQNYRSIVDSGEVAFDPEITCIVGKTGSGKTSFLRMLEGASRSVWFEERELPRSSDVLQDLRDGRRKAGEIVQLAAAFEVEDADRPRLPEECKGIKSVSIARAFDGKISICADGMPLERPPAVCKTGRLPGMLRVLNKEVAAAISEVGITNPNEAAEYAEGLRETMCELEVSDIRNKQEFGILISSLRNAVYSVPLGRAARTAIDQTLRSMACLAEEADREVKNHPVERLYSEIPKPLYMEDVFELDDKISINTFTSDADASRTFRCISAICGLAPGGVQRVRNADPSERAAYLKAMSDRLSDRLNSLWSQEVYRFELAVDSGMLQLRVSDRTTGATTLASERSEGFKWWVAFFLEVSALLAGGSGRRVLLLDNPATGLHDEGKGDVLRFVRTAAESGRLQIVYSTHERALIDPWRTDRVRIVELGKGGTRIATVPAKSDGVQLEPIMGNIGSPARYSLFGAPRMVCFEWPSDTYIVSAVNEYMLQGGARPALDRDTYSINSIGGIDAAPHACRLYGDLGIEFILVVDSGTETERMKKRLGDDHDAEERIVELRQVLGRDADMEDMVDRGLYYEAFRLAYRAILAENLPPVDEIDGNPSRKRANNYAEWFKKNSEGEFKKTLVAQQMFAVIMGRDSGAGAEKTAALDKTVKNFAGLFGIIAGRYGAATGR